jgi:long-subunit acyl-CoA synthetase (AMP-forming)
MDPRISETDFYNQILTYHPNIVLTTGSAWELFFNRIDHELKKGKTFDFSYAKGWTIGGEGTDVKKYKSWNRIMHICGGTRIYSGYGASELFSAVCVEKTNAKYDCSKSIMSVGIPYAGIIMGVYDKDGNELKYGERGELWVKSKSAMKEYYNKQELTSKTLVDGWIHTGDLAEIDENGFVYIWGRMNDIIMLPDGHSIFLFDIAKKIKDKNYINDAIVLPLSSESNKKQLVAHIVWMDKPAETEKIRRINELNAILQEFLPSGLTIIGYAEHDKMLPYLPTALKKDKNKMIKQTTGFYQVQNDKLEEIII